MHRVDAQGHQDHQFFDGDSTGLDIVPATVIGAAWLNDVQENLCKLIEARGGTLKKGDHKLLIQTIGKPLTTLENAVEELKRDVAQIRKEIG